MAAELSIRMLQMITGYWATQIVHAMAEFSVADHLAKEPLPALEVATKAAIDPTAAFRLLRAAASLGLVTYDDQQRFVATPLLDTLRSDAPGSLRGMAIAQASPGHWLPWGRFTDAVRTGSRQTLPTLGVDLFDYYAKSPAEGAAFTSAMSGMSGLVHAEVVRLLDVRSVSTIVDVGGAAGTLVLALLAAHPHLKGGVLDLPHVTPDAKAAAEARGLSERFSATPGDFFKAVPPADIYLLKFILHDWDDKSCETILRNCARSLRPGGRVVVVELPLGAIGEPSIASQMDLNMMVLLTGKERSPAEFGELFARSGLKMHAVTPTHSPFTILEATAA